MIEKPKIGETYIYRPIGHPPMDPNLQIPVRITGFRAGTLVITEGVEDGRRRDVSRKRLEY